MGTILKSPKKVKTNEPKYSIVCKDGNDIEIIDEFKNLLFFHNFCEGPSEISCGVLEISDLPENKHFKDILVTFEKVKANKIIKEAFIKYFNNVLKNNIESIKGCAFLILSNNLKASSSITNEILSEICAKTEIRKNPNTNNNIVIYIY